MGAVRQKWKDQGHTTTRCDEDRCVQQLLDLLIERDLVPLDRFTADVRISASNEGYHFFQIDDRSMPFRARMRPNGLRLVSNDDVMLCGHKVRIEAIGSDDLRAPVVEECFTTVTGSLWSHL